MERKVKADALALLKLSPESAGALLRAVRWADGVFCPHCKSRDVWLHNRGYKADCWRYRCRSCKRTFTDKTKALFESSHLKLPFWFAIIWLMSANFSIKQIANELGIAYSSAYKIVMKVMQTGYVLVYKKTPRFGRGR